MVLRKYELEGALAEENLMIKSGRLRDENPLDTSAEFNAFLLACRHGDLKNCQELINQGVNINGKDRFDYTPLIIASLCGHYELVRLLLEAGALAERNTFQGERCIYNALNDRIRNLLLQYDFSKSSDPHVYWSTHVSSLLDDTLTDISLIAGNDSFALHKFILASRTPYFRKKLEAQPETTTWKLASTIPVEAFEIALRYVYLGNLPRDLVPSDSAVSEEEVLKGLDKISKQLEIEQLWEAIMVSGDRRMARQRYQDEVGRALQQFQDFFTENVLGKKMVVDAERVNEVKWKHDNSIFADVLLRADEPVVENDKEEASQQLVEAQVIPIGPAAISSTAQTTAPKTTRKAVLYPAHKAMLIRSEYFQTMFSSAFKEAHDSTHLRIITIDCSPTVLEIILRFLYTENTDKISLDAALDLLYAADMLFLDTLKAKAAVAISTLGNGTTNVHIDTTSDGKPAPIEVEPVNIYDVIHAAWDLRVQRLEEFAARYLAQRLEDYIDEDDFAELIRESAGRLKSREETDTIELLDDIRYYLGERFRLRFEDAGIEELMDEEGEISAEVAADIAEVSEGRKGGQGGEEKVEEEEDEDDEFANDAINYQVLLGKIDSMLEKLKLDA